MDFRSTIAGKRILITGGTGTVGREVIRRVLPLAPKVVRVFSRDETKHYHLQEQLREHANVRFLVGDVRDKDRLRMALENVDVLIHLAAMKHVESCEYNPFEAIKTNIIGTQNVVDAALDAGVARVVLSSSDKAVNPCNAMGASKLMAEKLMIAANHYKGARTTIFSGIRFGNVLGSSGSVVPRFIGRIRNGEPIEVTHEGMSRFVTSYSDAVELLMKALCCARGGEVFIRKMPVIRVIDLAEVLIDELGALYGRPEVPIRMIGVRVGEKLFEELYTSEESTRTVEHGDYYIVEPQLGERRRAIRGAAPVPIGAYSSDVEEPMTRTELRDLLYREKIFTQFHGAGSAGEGFELSDDLVAAGAGDPHQTGDTVS